MVAVPEAILRHAFDGTDCAPTAPTSVTMHDTVGTKAASKFNMNDRNRTRSHKLHAYKR